MKLALLALLFSLNVFAQEVVVPVVMETSMGTIEIELYESKAPKTVENFLKYVDDKFYDGTIFHRVIDGFMVQGGGMTPNMREKATRDPIQHEGNTGLSNDVGYLAMARTMDPHSATAQFFINVANNTRLNYSAPTDSGWGYVVFGKVTSGMDIVNQMKAVKTRTFAGHQNVPVDTITIKSVRRQTKKKK